ncbi:hypothetical protein VP1G_02719 [Cytospora mali]|uniref:Protein kinase domain-containing protein n=1 Tax=Cytospora mali TaxID=578113 RepID=A0A194UUL1_CYTMA|nr:hypothetical protein VP1G_02719 [Valsa mali var. pyri (nom. inval.)]
MLTSSLRFATLTPENEAAQKCLASLVDKQFPQFPHLHQNPESSINPVAAVVPAPLQPTHRAAQGAFGVVRLGVDRVGVDRRSGDIVACKTIYCRRHRDIQTVNNEIDIASKVLPHTVLEHLASLQSYMPDNLGALLRSMLAWDPADRPTAEQALADKVWGQIVAMGPGSEKESARETQSNGESSGPGPSRTRIRLQRSGGPSPSASGGTNKADPEVGRATPV